VLVLAQDVPTRWTETYFMLRRVTHLGKYIYRILAESDKHHIIELDMTAKDLYQLKNLCNGLAPQSIREKVIVHFHWWSHHCIN